MANVVELIKQDHREVEALFTEFQQTSDEKIAMKICEELDAHATAEEKVFYPAVRELQGDKQMVSHAEDEHSEAKQLIGRINQTK